MRSEIQTRITLFPLILFLFLSWGRAQGDSTTAAPAKGDCCKEKQCTQDKLTSFMGELKKKATEFETAVKACSGSSGNETTTSASATTSGPGTTRAPSVTTTSLPGTTGKNEDKKSEGSTGKPEGTTGAPPKKA